MEKEIKWTAPEFEYHHKETGWYWLVVIGMVVLIGLALLQKNFLFAIFVILAGILVLKMGHQTPQYIDFLLSGAGLEIGKEKIYPFDELSGFATKRIDRDEEGMSELIFHRKHRLSIHLRVLFPTKMSDEIRHFINQHLPELEHEDSLTEHISKLLKF